MRYDKPIYFRLLTRGEYDSSTGNYGPDIAVETKRYADVQSTDVEVMRLVYGEIRQGSLTVSLLQKYEEPFHQIRIGAKLYAVDYRNDLRSKQVFVVSEVQ